MNHAETFGLEDQQLPPPLECSVHVARIVSVVPVLLRTLSQ